MLWIKVKKKNTNATSTIRIPIEQNHTSKTGSNREKPVTVY